MKFVHNNHIVIFNFTKKLFQFSNFTKKHEFFSSFLGIKKVIEEGGGGGGNGSQKPQNVVAIPKNIQENGMNVEKSDELKNHET